MLLFIYRFIKLNWLGVGYSEGYNTLNCLQINHVGISHPRILKNSQWTSSMLLTRSLLVTNFPSNLRQSLESFDDFSSSLLQLLLLSRFSRVRLCATPQTAAQ